jgi:hypothetical protein
LRLPPAYMKQKIELTSKPILAIIIALTSVSAIVVPTYATTIPNNTTSFDDNIVNGQNIPSQEDIRNLVSDAIQQLNVVAISSPTTVIQPNSGSSFRVECPEGMFATGGGFFTSGTPVDVSVFQPELSGGREIRSGDTPDEWHAVLDNPTEGTIPANVWVVCVGLGQ